MARMKENIRFIQDQGILISAWFAIGYEDDDVDTYYRTFEFCNEMNLMPVFTPVNALTGTDLYLRLMKENKLRDTTPILTNVPHHTMTNEQVHRCTGINCQKRIQLSYYSEKNFFLCKENLPETKEIHE